MNLPYRIKGPQRKESRTRALEQVQNGQHEKVQMRSVGTGVTIKGAAKVHYDLPDDTIIANKSLIDVTWTPTASNRLDTSTN